MLRNTLINLTLKIGLMISLLYSSLAAFVVPAKVVEYWPSFISNNLSEGFLSLFTGLLALVYILWIFSAKYRFQVFSSLSTIIALFAISNFSNVGLLFSIAPIFSITLALSLRYYPRIRVVAQTKVTPLDIDGEAEIDEESSNQNSEKDHDQHLFVSGN